MISLRERGFSLIELLIAVAISLVAMIAAIEVYNSTRQTYRVQGMQSRLSEDARFAISMIERVVMQAGFRLSPIADMPVDRIAVAGNVLTLKFEPDGFNQIACDGSLPIAGMVQTLVVKKTGNKLQCGGIDWIAPATVGAGDGTEVVDFAVLMGIDTGPAMTPENFGCGIAIGGFKSRDCIPDKYAAVLSVGESVGQIAAVRVCLVLRSESKDGSIIKPTAVKDCSLANISGSQDDMKLYRTFWSTIMLKNR